MEVTLPFVIHPRVRKGLGRLATMTAFGVLASTGVAAAASCPTVSTTTPFSQFGDNNSYFVAPGGTFEASSLPAGSVANNASLTAGNEPWHVVSSSDNQSLTIQAGGSYTMPYTCIDSTMQSFRFFAQQASGGSDLKVEVLVKLGTGTYDLPMADLADGSTPNWAPSGQIFAPNGNALALGQTAQAALKFSVPGNAGAWQIDDILIDPYRSA